MKNKKLLLTKLLLINRFSYSTNFFFYIRLLFLLLVLMGFTTNSISQTDVSGTVKDQQGLPLPGVTVQEKGTTNGTQTDFDGNYSISISDENAVLSFSFMGMTSVERPVEGNYTINVEMKMAEESLEEVVLVGYGTQDRRSVSTSISKVSSDDFNQGVVTSPLNLVQGKVPGLSITQSGGNDPNGATSIQLRGVTSITGNTDPLIVIDGIPGGNLDLIQQNDIDSFDVLKSGAASAIYGTRGNNGVILITTKKGKAGVTSFEYSTYVSQNYVNRIPEFLSANQYREALDQGIIRGTDYGYSTDIYDELVNESNFSQYHNFIASGGAENSNYRVSVYYRNLEGIAQENEREEFGVRASFNQSAFDDRLNFQSSIATNFNNANLLGSRLDDNGNPVNQFGIVADWNPTTPIYAEPGGDLNNQGQFGYYQPENLYNPFSQYANRTNKRREENFSGDAKVSFEIFEGLIASAFGSYQRNTWNDRLYRTTEDWEQYNSGSQYNGTGYASKGNHMDHTVTFEPTITLDKEINDHVFSVLGGYSYQYLATEEYSMNNSGFTNDAFQDWNFGSGNAINDLNLPRPGMNSFKEDNTLIAFFSRINYSFKNKYFFTASIRHEGSSKFGENNKWGNFPAVSGGWLISDEAFMDEVDFISNLKLRADYGITGNQGIPNYQSLYTLGTGGKYPIYLDGSESPVYYQTYGPNNNPNPNLKWERKKEWDIGVDFGFLNNKITGSVDYYDRKTEDLLLSYTVPQPSYVQPAIYTNVGTISNTGLELALSVKTITTNDFSWNIDFAGSYQQNEIVTLSNDQFFISELFGGNIGNPGNLGDAIRNTEGGPIGDFWGKKFAGFTDAGEWLFYKADGSTARASEMNPREDNRIIGNGMPKYNASLTNTFKYKNWDLTVFLRGKFDFDILNTVNLFYGNPNIGGNVLTSAIGEYSHISEQPQYSDYYLEKGDFVKLDNLTLGYTFNLGEKSAFSGLRIYANARNLATITGYSGIDPEVENTGLYPGVNYRNFYPRTTTVTAGIDVKF